MILSILCLSRQNIFSKISVNSHISQEKVSPVNILQQQE